MWGVSAALPGVKVTEVLPKLAQVLAGRGRIADFFDVRIEALTQAGISRDEFLAALPESDASWTAAVEDARANNSVVRYRVRVTRGGVRAGLARVPVGSPLASLDGTDNLFVFMTKRYRQRPLDDGAH